MKTIHLWRSGLWLLVLALMLAQQLGVTHRITHGPGLASTVDSADVRLASNPHTIDATRWIAGLFSGHNSDAGCRLFDANGQGAAPAVPTLVLPVAVAAGVLLFFQLATVAVSPALFEARAPPVLR